MSASDEFLRSRLWRERVRPRCYERDRKANAACWICGQPIDYHLTDGPDCWEPDHYLPRSTHPELAADPRNIRPSHRSCNRRRSDSMLVKPAADLLGVPSETW